MTTCADTHFFIRRMRIGDLYQVQALYRSFGFQEVGQHPGYYKDNKEDALLLSVWGLDDCYLRWLEEGARGNAWSQRPLNSLRRLS